MSNLPKTYDLDFLANHKNQIHQVAEWLNNEWGYLHPNRSYQDLCSQLESIVNIKTPPLHIIALDEDKLVGVVALKLTEMEMFPEREHWLGSLFVAPENRGQGIATLLEEEIVRLANTLSVSELYLQTEALDGGLYSRLGWKEREKVSDQGIKVLVMEKRL